MDGHVNPIFKTPELETRWKDDYSAVLVEFNPLPAHKIVCYFDDESVCLRGSERGMFVPDIGNPDNRNCWPPYVKKHLSDEFEALIYIPGRVCCVNQSILFVMAFAHELQHFAQWATEPKAWATDKRLRGNCLELQLGKPWDIPTDGDAVVVSKAVAEAIAGRDEVSSYAKAQMDTIEANYWAFFDSILPSRKSDWVEKTERLDFKLCRLTGQLR